MIYFNRLSTCHKVSNGKKRERRRRLDNSVNKRRRKRRRRRRLRKSNRFRSSFAVSRFIAYLHIKLISFLPLDCFILMTKNN